jgi:hypothetical protein
MSVDLIALWHARARPNPNHEDLNVQVGGHFEEVAEMLEEMTGADDYAELLLVKATAAVHRLAEAVKAGEAKLFIRDRKQFLDSLGDQIVTATGVGYCARMNIVEGVRRINTSNWSKFDTNGEPVRNANGKITKGPKYTPPDLDGLY